MPDKHEVGGSSPLGPTTEQSSELRIENGKLKIGFFIEVLANVH